MRPVSPPCSRRRWPELARRAEPAKTQGVSSDPPASAEATTIYVDADACPVKDEAVRVAERHGLDIHFVSNAFMRLPEGPLIHRVVVAEGPDAADDWIAERIDARDIAVTADIPLAARCLKKGAAVIGPTGKPFTEAGIGMALAMRELSQHLRETGESKGYNASFTRQDRSRFLEALELAVRRAKG
jgi:uncharacterized protein